MARETNIPLFLWIATAVLAHLAWGGGVTRMSKALEETLDIKRFAMSVQRHVHSGGEVEIALLDENAPEEQKPEEPKPDETATKEDEPPDETQDESDKKDEATKKEE